MKSSNTGTDIAINMQARPVVEQMSATAKTWIAMFPLAILSLAAASPSAVVSVTAAIVLMFAMMVLVQNATTQESNERTFAVKQQFVSLLAATQFACLIWVAILVGRMMFGASLMASTLAAFAVFAVVVVIEGLVSTYCLLMAERTKGTSGASLAALISAKYAGLLGKIAG